MNELALPYFPQSANCTMPALDEAHIEPSDEKSFGHMCHWPHRRPLMPPPAQR
jgi:hypothetical protein